MSMLDLQQHLKQGLENNPFLELVEAEEDDEDHVELEEDAADVADEVDWEDLILDGFSPGVSRGEFEEREVFERTAVLARDLSDHLNDQLQLLELSTRQRLLAEVFVGNIADDGYLRATLEEVVQVAGNVAWERRNGSREAAEPFTVDEAEELLYVIQRLDPAGICARDLRECLLLQLEDAGEADSLAYRLVDEAFEDVLNHRWVELGKRYDVEPKLVQDAADALARFDPKPGLRYSNRDDAYVTPDLVVEKIDGRYRVFLNDGGMPRLRISQVYKDIAGDKSRFVGANRDFITEKLNSATWLVQAIEQRRQTMLKVMNFIVDRQRDFFEKGVEHLKPLTLRDVADVIEMHESTVSRVTSQKYVQTPRGVYSLKFFFSSSLGTTNGEDASSRSVKAQLRKLVAEEDARKPLTDSALVSALKVRGIRIARRTVAKYRDQLRIQPARMRRRL